MASGDRTGPVGQGPMTGRGLGYCGGYDSPGYTKGAGGGMGRGFGFGRGFGRGGGRGRGRWFSRMQSGVYPVYPWPAPPSREDEIRMLKAQAEDLERTRKEIEKRLNELEKSSAQ